MKLKVKVKLEICSAAGRDEDAARLRAAVATAFSTAQSELQDVLDDQCPASLHTPILLEDGSYAGTLTMKFKL